MEPNKFEHIAKEKLAKREIQPSNAAWDRLDAMLTAQEKPKKKNKLWLYIAASLFLTLGITLWNIENKTSVGDIPQTTIVNTTDENSLSKDEMDNQTKNESNYLIEKKVPIQDEVLVENQLEPKEKQELKKKESVQQNSALAQNKTSEKKNRNTMSNQIEQIGSKLQYISPEKLLSSIENETKESIAITTSKPNDNKVKVDANTLLSSVESEITEEYRETTFDKMKRKFNQAKSAVANRNYE